MFICFVLHSCIFTLIHTLSTRGRRGELNEKFRKMHLKFGSLRPHVQRELAFFSGGAFLLFFSMEFVLIWKFASTCSGGACICSGGAFLLFFSMEFVLCLACDLSLPFFGFGHELSFFAFTFFFLSFSEFHFALCVGNALIKGEIED
jgi:hypothetical protein